MQLGLVAAGDLSDRQPLLRFCRAAVHRAERPDVIPYLARRIVPQPGAPNFATRRPRTPCMQGDRLDLIAAKYLGDPLMSWLICDANGAIRPDDLVATPGTRLDDHHAAGRSGRRRVLKKRSVHADDRAPSSR